MAEHTPTPWDLCRHLESAEKDTACKCGYRGGIWGDAGELLVCEMRNCDLHEGHDMIPVGDRATQLANAAFIVKAVNSHDALVKALQSVWDFMNIDVQNGDADLWTEEYDALHAEVCAALNATIDIPSFEATAGERVNG
jgi:hypothetical protein